MSTNNISTANFETTDPVLLALSKRVASQAKLSILKAIANHNDSKTYPIQDKDSLEQKFLTYFNQLSVQKQKDTVSRALPLITTIQETQNGAFGNLINVRLDSGTSIKSQTEKIQLLSEVTTIDLNKLQSQIQSRTLKSEIITGLRPQQASNTISFIGDNVYCFDTVGYFDIANDNIVIGGVTVDTLGNVGIVNPVMVGGFDGGTSRPFPSNPFASFTIDSLINWPKTYSVSLVMSSEPEGGIYDFLLTLAEDARSEIAKYLIETLTTTAGGIIGGIVGSVLPIVGTAIGSLVGALVGFVVGRVIDEVWDFFKNDLFGDKIFAPITYTLTVGSPNSTFNGSLDSDEIKIEKEAYSGDYAISSHWNLNWGMPDVNACWHTWCDHQSHDAHFDFSNPITSSEWAGWESLGGALNFDPAICSWKQGRLDLFVVGTDNALWHKWYENGWSDWESWGGVLTSGPAAVSWSENRIDIVARGVDNALWHIWWDDGFRGNWESLGGISISPPSICAWKPGRLDVFTVGTDNALWHKWYENGWSDWESLGGSLTSGPAAVCYTENSIDIVARGTDNAVWLIGFNSIGNIYSNPTGWSAWKSLGGIVNFRPAICVLGGTRVVFAVGTDNALYYKTWNIDWSDWHSLGGFLTSGPAAVSWNQNRIDVIARGA